jgi:hypothetical protein
MRQGCGVNYPPLSGDEVKLNVLPVCAFMLGYRVTFTFTFYSTPVSVTRQRRTVKNISGVLIEIFSSKRIVKSIAHYILKTQLYLPSININNSVFLHRYTACCDIKHAIANNVPQLWSTYYSPRYFFSVALKPNAGHGLRIFYVSRFTHSKATQSVGLLWTSDQLVAEKYSRKNTTLTR